MVYSVDIIHRGGELATQKRLSALPRYRLKQEYSEMCAFLRARISLAIVRSNSLLLRVHHNKRESIGQRPDTKDGTVMALLAPWQGYFEGY